MVVSHDDDDDDDCYMMPLSSWFVCVFTAKLNSKEEDNVVQMRKVLGGQCEDGV